MAISNSGNSYIRAVSTPSYMVIVRKKIRQTFHFYLKESKEKDGQFLIVGRLTISRKKVEFATGIWVKKNEWDEKSEQLINKSKNMDAHKIMIELESEINKIIEHREAMGLSVNPKIIKRIYKGEIDKDSVEGETFTLLQYFDSFISFAEKNITEYTDATVQHYRTTKSHLEVFLKSLGLNDIPLHLVDSACLQKFDDHLVTWVHPKLKKTMNRNSANKYMSKLRACLHKARREKLIAINPFADFKLKHFKPKSSVLIDQHLIKIAKKHLDNESLERVKDYLLLSTYMGGMRYSDLSTLKVNNIFQEDGFYFVYLNGQVKTDNSVHTPLLPPAVAILKKYEAQQAETGYILPKLSHQKLNTYLKTLADKCEIEFGLTHKIARHTFATTICGRNGIPRHITSAWIGHVQPDTPTNTYAQVTKEEAFKYLRILWEIYSKEEFLPKIINR